MTYDYRLRSAVAAVFATASTFLFALTTITGQAGLVGALEGMTQKSPFLSPEKRRARR